MRRRAKMDTTAGKVAVEVLAGGQGGGGSFALAEAAEEGARRTK
jgi:hypothetical protein